MYWNDPLGDEPYDPSDPNNIAAYYGRDASNRQRWGGFIMGRPELTYGYTSTNMSGLFTAGWYSGSAYATGGGSYFANSSYAYQSAKMDMNRVAIENRKVMERIMTFAVQLLNSIDSPQQKQQDLLASLTGLPSRSFGSNSGEQASWAFTIFFSDYVENGEGDRVLAITSESYERSNWEGGVIFGFDITMDLIMFSSSFVSSMGEDYAVSVGYHEIGHIHQFMDIVNDPSFSFDELNGTFSDIMNTKGDLSRNERDDFFVSMMVSALDTWELNWDSYQAREDDANLRAIEMIRANYEGRERRQLISNLYKAYKFSN